MRVSFIRACMYALARCQRSQLPLFQDFYNWEEAVSRINAPTEGRIGQLFNGIVITGLPGRGITLCSPAYFLPPSSAYFPFLSFIPLLPSHSSHFLFSVSLVCRSSRSVLVFSFLSSFRLRYSALCPQLLTVLLSSIFCHCRLSIVLYCIKLSVLSVYENKYKMLSLYIVIIHII